MSHNINSLNSYQEFEKYVPLVIVGGIGLGLLGAIICGLTYNMFRTIPGRYFACRDCVKGFLLCLPVSGNIKKSDDPKITHLKPDKKPNVIHKIDDFITRDL